MKRYSLFFGILGVTAGIILLAYSFVAPKTDIALKPLPEETLVYDVGTAHELPGTSSMLYENTALGLRFGYPTSYGKVVVEKRSGGVFLSFSPSGTTNDPKRAYFMVAQYTAPTDHAEYWGDLSWFTAVDPRWKQELDVCGIMKDGLSNYSASASWAKNFLSSAPCENIPFEDGGIAKLTNRNTAAYLIPSFIQTVDHVALDLFVASDERLLGKPDFENPVGNMQKLVQSIEFIAPGE